jgi:hypothetical protein
VVLWRNLLEIGPKTTLALTWRIAALYGVPKVASSTAMDRSTHWDQIYQTKNPDSVSWYQERPIRSLEYIQKYSVPSQRIIEVGAGASALIDALLQSGFGHLTALDVSAAALARVQSRLGPRAVGVQWIVADITQSPELPTADLWHDRAVLHFLTSHDEQRSYAELAAKTILSGGHLIIATFAPDGPERCSGLPVRRHDGASLSTLFGAQFDLVEETRDVHRTPSGAEQRFCWTVFRRRA